MIDSQERWQWLRRHFPVIWSWPQLEEDLYGVDLICQLEQSYAEWEGWT